MAQMAIPLNPIGASRTRAMWVPREHGAWGLLLVPLVTGAGAVSGIANYGVLTWFALAAIALFWLRTPVESLVGTSIIRARTVEERRTALNAVVIVGVIASLALIALFWNFQHLALALIGAIAGLAFLAQAILKKRARKYRAIAQIVGSVGLASTAASAYYLRSGSLSLTALLLWIVNWLFAAEQIEFVQLRIQGAKLETPTERVVRGKAYITTLSFVLIIIVSGSVVHLLPALTFVAFIPSLLRSSIWLTSSRKPLDVHKLGWLELTNAVLFAVLLITAFRVGSTGRPF